MTLTPLGSRGMIGGALGRGYRRAAAAVPWWLSGGVAAANCIAAYQAKGAADYAASLVNLANPMVSTSKVTGLADPAWDATNGWMFDGATQKLESGVIGGVSVVIRFSNAITSAYYVSICGKRSTNSILSWNMNPISGINLAFNLCTTSASSANHAISSGVIAGVTGVGGYKNGQFNLAVTGTTTTFDGHIGGTGGWAPTFKAAYVQAFSAYSVAITPEQVAAISAAMAAL